MTTQEQDQIERLIDLHGLQLVLGAIANICALKSAHVRETWQDERLARDWLRAMTVVDRAADSTAITKLPQ